MERPRRHQYPLPRLVAVMPRAVMLRAVMPRAVMPRAVMPRAVMAQASLVLNSLLKQELTHSVLKLTHLPMFTRRIINWCPVKRLVVRPNLHMVRTGKLLGPRQKFLSMREVGLHLPTLPNCLPHLSAAFSRQAL